MIFIQVGQCGIQCGQEIIQKINKNNKSGDLIKELLIDTESKVLNECKYKNGIIKGKHKKFFQIGKDGSGNNWSFGYSKVDSELINSIMDNFSQLIESIDLHKGLNFVHSIAGGTGSGLFSRVIEEIRDRYPKTCISTYSIFPFESGENSLQYYNSIFSLSWVQKFADIIYCFSNKEILDIFTNIKSSKNYSLNDINSFISDCASSLYPFGNKNEYINTWDIIYDICPIPSMKLLKVFSESTLENLVKILPSNYNNDKLISGRLNLLSENDTDKRILNKLYKRIGALSHTEALTIRFLKSEISNNIFNKKENCNPLYLFNFNSKSRASILKNSTDILPTLSYLLNQSEYMYKNKAFWSYFKNYNENIDELFIESYNTLYNCKNDYHECIEIKLQFKK
ncbi:tubulin nucleotide-binding domain-like protein [Neocallimastix lanati (nom. inval.)]|uniref:Tubulin nucleotide-binding domain-like protein n=1 Tax=Neocallimastix californiae TaxID=1754190 RepID=A0A1Y2DMU3_9FUNG|nr:tubulin nucleotide-binding domain-like protein [Neocallimastix sp. JGI-2020a]ORY60489.1 tubulin nucleotide-binding domain-like protein [Neocallimastix californiae]|eukprot:ORY60489.1 tubulin nucleotide-binding domain-like protein [Neocallimastix californiae]